MKKFLKILGIVLILLLAGAVTVWFLYLKPTPPPISAEDRARLQVMPLPAELQFGNGSIQITEKFGITFENEPSPRLEKAVDRFYEQLEAKTGFSFTERSGDQLVINNPIDRSSFPQLGENESYDLMIKGDKITLNASSDSGILYGLETLLQLAESRSDQWYFPELELKDLPRYPWRGLMIDVSRHWMPKDVILRNLDAMAKLKMNVFHWHLSDYQGFRVESKLFPKLHTLGSQGNYYTQDDIREIVAFAADRSIRVVPEFDVPGHSSSWLVGYPELGSAPGPYVIDTIALGVFRPVLDPTNPNVYTFLDQFIGEMTTLFPDTYFHIGGDEVMAKDWEENQNIQAFMKSNDLADSHELQAYFNLKMQKILSKHNKIMLGWDEILNNDLPKDGIAVQSWRNHKSLWDAAKKGHKAILSTGYYLDHKKSAGSHYQVDPEVIKGAVTIDIDSTNWTSWKTNLTFGETVIEGDIYTFGNDNDLRIIMDFMENPVSNSKVDKKGNSIEFTNETDYGKMKVILNIQGDSLLGTSSLALFQLDLKGVQTGGSDLPNGIPLPTFEKIEPLTPIEAANILGGEACMWTEMVDSITLESRIWPRTAAIAEKLWSPKELTNDTRDMYRRLIHMDSLLESNGLQHKFNQKVIIADMVDPEYAKSLKQFTDILQEGAFLNRLSLYEPTLYTSTPLNRVVDAAPAESYAAYKFNVMVSDWLDTKDPLLKGKIRAQLLQWSETYEKLLPIFESNQRLAMVTPHLINLSILSELALKKLNGEPLDLQHMKISDQLLLARNEHGGTVLAVVQGLENLILEDPN